MTDLTRHLGGAADMLENQTASQLCSRISFTAKRVLGNSKSRKKRGWEQGERRGSTYRTVRAEQPPEHTRLAATSTSCRPVRTVTKPRDGVKAELLQPRSQDGHVSRRSDAATIALSRLYRNSKVKSNFSRKLVERLRPNYDTRTNIFIRLCEVVKLISPHRVHDTKKTDYLRVEWHVKLIIMIFEYY